jgi:hypothetical protein
MIDPQQEYRQHLAASTPIPPAAAIPTKTPPIRAKTYLTALASAATFLAITVSLSLSADFIGIAHNHTNDIQLIALAIVLTTLLILAGLRHANRKKTRLHGPNCAQAVPWTTP